MRAFRVRALLMGGQACVFYGAAEFSRDTDFAIFADAANLARLRQALTALVRLEARSLTRPMTTVRYESRLGLTTTEVAEYSPIDREWKAAMHSSRVRAFAILAGILGAVLSASAESRALEEISSHMFTNAAIVWQAPTNQLPKSIWVYRRILPRVFPEAIVSNAIVLGSLQSKGFPKPSTNYFGIREDKGPHYDPWAAHHDIFGIYPDIAYLFYSVPDYNADSGKDIPTDETIARQAWKCAAQLGLDPAMLVQGDFFTHFCDTEQNGEVVHHVCGRGVFLSRQLHGVAFLPGRDEGDAVEGFAIQFGSHGQLRGFSLCWPTLERHELQAIIGPQEIIRCVKEHKISVLPIAEEKDFFGRLQELGKAKKLIINKITPYYADFVFRDVSTNNASSQFATPLAELEAVADFGNTNASIRLLAPIIPSEVSRLMGN
jgi:hypothetical protein